MSGAVSLFVDTSGETEAELKSSPMPVNRKSVLALQLAATVKADDVIERVAARFDVPAALIISKCRRSNVANARHVVVWLLRRYGMSFQSIGDRIGGRNHTTVMASLAKIERERAASQEVARMLGGLLQEIATGASSGPMASSGSNTGSVQQ